MRILGIPRFGRVFVPTSQGDNISAKSVFEATNKAPYSFGTTQIQKVYWKKESKNIFLTRDAETDHISPYMETAEKAQNAINAYYKDSSNPEKEKKMNEATADRDTLLDHFVTQERSGIVKQSKSAGVQIQLTA